MLERWQIEGRSATAIAEDLKAAFDEHAGAGGQAGGAPGRPRRRAARRCPIA
jgi:hypothetical protein